MKITEEENKLFCSCVLPLEARWECTVFQIASLRGEENEMAIFGVFPVVNQALISRP